MIRATIPRIVEMPPNTVLVEVAIADASAEPIHLEVNGRPVCKLTPESAERLAENLRQAAAQVRPASPTPAPSPKAQTATRPE